MNAQEQQNYFNELAERMMRGEITAEQASSFYNIKKLKAEIAELKKPLLEKANALLKKINPNISVSEKNSISQLQEMILELETSRP